MHRYERSGNVQIGTVPVLRFSAYLVPCVFRAEKVKKKAIRIVTNLATFAEVKSIFEKVTELFRQS